MSFRVNLRIQDYQYLNQLIEWVRANVGNGGWYSRIIEDFDWVVEERYTRQLSFIFRREEDKVRFLLNWPEIKEVP